MYAHPVSGLIPILLLTANDRLLVTVCPSGGPRTATRSLPMSHGTPHSYLFVFSPLCEFSSATKLCDRTLFPSLRSSLFLAAGFDTPPLLSCRSMSLGISQALFPPLPCCFRFPHAREDSPLQHLRASQRSVLFAFTLPRFSFFRVDNRTISPPHARPLFFGPGFLHHLAHFFDSFSHKMNFPFFLCFPLGQGRHVLANSFARGVPLSKLDCLPFESPFIYF